MSRLVLVVLLLLVLPAAPGWAQTSAPPPSTVATQTAAPAPLPVDTRIAFVNLQVVFNESTLGKQGQEKWQALNEKLFSGLSTRKKEIDTLSEKIRAQQSVVGQEVVRAWNLELQRLQREAEFAQQEAQVQSDQLQQEVLATFEKQIVPVIDALRAEKGLHAIFAIQEGGGLRLMSVEPRLDLSAEVIRRLNGR